MADETKVTEQQEQKQQTEQQQTEPEKKYTDDDVNAISLKNSDKAVKKLLKELGIDATDEGKASAKQILAEAKAKAAKEQPEKAAEDSGKYEAAIQKVAMAQGTIALIGKGVPAEKASRFAKLLDLTGVMDDSGEIDNDKMGAAVDALLKDWPEALGKAGDKIGFKIGSDGKENKENAEEAEMDKWRKEAGLKK